MSTNVTITATTLNAAEIRTEVAAIGGYAPPELQKNAASSGLQASTEVVFEYKK